MEKQWLVELHVSHGRTDMVCVYITNTQRDNEGSLECHSFADWRHALAHIGLWLTMADATIKVR